MNEDHKARLDRAYSGFGSHSAEYTQAGSTPSSQLDIEAEIERRILERSGLGNAKPQKSKPKLVDSVE